MKTFIASSTLLAGTALLAGTTLLAAAELEIPFEKYKLDNGLRVILSKDNSAPVVAVYVIYDVGARSEEKGRTGFAHLFEHMMFQGSKNAPKGVHFQTVESNGGNLNGSTHPDFTDYFEVLPSNKLPVALWLESDRMRGLNITEENLNNQKEAVKQERRLSFDNRAYATAIVDEFPKLFFENFQSNHSLIGSYEDLNAATVDDVAKFFKTYYAPNNAVLVVVGDIQPAEAKKWIEAYFGDIPSVTRPPKPDLTEPEKTKATWVDYKDPLAKLPAVVVAYPAPKRRSPDYYAMVMLDVLLTGGSSSRFNLNLVKGNESVVGFEANLGWPFAGANDYVDPSPYGMAFYYKPNFTAKQVVEQAEAEIARVKKEGVPAGELSRIKTFFRSDRIRSVRTVLRRAQLLGQYEIFDGDPGMIDSELDQFLAVTSERIQAAANKYCDPGKRTVLNIVPSPKKAEKESGQ